MTANPEAEAEAVAVAVVGVGAVVGAVAVAGAEDEFEVEAEVAFEAFVSPLQGTAWEQNPLFQVLGGCLRDEAWEGGL